MSVDLIVKDGIESLDYQAIWDEATGHTVAEKFDAIRADLVEYWYQLYERRGLTSGRFEAISEGTFSYAFDRGHDQQVPAWDYDTMIQFRVVSVLGLSKHVAKPRDPHDKKVPLPRVEYGKNAKDLPYDRGHLIAHSIGGIGDLAIVSQPKRINRGSYRRMEEYARRHPGTLVFSRPIYGDTTTHPFWIEYGVLMEDQKFWVETFPNRYRFTAFKGVEPDWYKEVHEEELARQRRRRERYDKRMAEIKSSEKSDDGA